jgi:hypothetical protein
MATSLTKLDLHLLKVGLIFLKIQPFICFQMHQQAMITILVKQGPKKDLFANDRVAKLFPGIHGICR